MFFDPIYHFMFIILGIFLVKSGLEYTEATDIRSRLIAWVIGTPIVIHGIFNSSC